MNKKEFLKVSVALKAAYPRFTFLATDEEMEFWYQMLQDMDYKIAENAVEEHISTSIYPPCIAEIRKLCTERTQKPLLSFDEAWGVVQNAIRNYGLSNQLEAYAVMDGLTLSVVKNLGWSSLCQSENPTADRANFREAYEAKAKIVQNNLQLPEFVIRDKLQIQEYYNPVIEKKVAPEIGKAESGQIREELTEEQLARRSQMVEEARRRILGGETERSTTGN